MMARILVVEDDPAIAVALEDDLRLEGHAVEVVHDGEAAVGRGRQGAFDLVLLDIMLPKKDGFEVCRELRKAGVESKILMLTARGSESEKVLGLELGADDYVTKPYSPKELRARVRAHLRRGAADAAMEVARFGDCELDFKRGELRRGGRPVPTTPLELKLLGLFVRRPRADAPHAHRRGVGPGHRDHRTRRRQPDREPAEEDRTIGGRAAVPEERARHRVPIRSGRRDRIVTPRWSVRERQPVVCAAEVGG